VDSFTLSKVEFDAVRHVLARYAACSLGRRQALKIGPSRNPETITRWLRQTEQMVRVLREVGLPPFGGVTDISGPLKRAVPAGGAAGEDFAQIASALDGAANVRAYLAALPEDCDLLHEFVQQIGAFDGEVKAIRAVIDADGAVRDDASPRLAELRRGAQAIEQQIREVIYSYVKNPDVAKLLTQASVTMHGDRFVLPVRWDHRGRLPGVVHRASNTGATVFVEPNACVELNNRLADVREDERHEVQRLLNELAVRIHKRAEEMASTLRALAHVDVLSAKAQYAYQFEMTRPEVAEHGSLQFLKARHPLLIEQDRQQFEAGLPPEKRHHVTPIDVRLGSDFDLLIITGSNTGGKTVALKTVALLVLMAQSGLFIPAQRGAALPVFRDIFIDVGDEQSLEQSLSTFSGHIQRIKHILRKADRQSLVLLDELGSGTDPDEGGAIGQAVLDELRQIGCLGMVTTHLSVLKAYAFNQNRVDNASVEFDTKTLSPTYRLLIGTPGESHAITVAERLGAPRRVIARARRHLSGQGKMFRRAIQATNIARQNAEDARSSAKEAQLEAQSRQEAYEAKLADLHRLREEFEAWLARLGEMKPGDTVHVPSMNKEGTLVRLEFHKQLAVVNVDRLQVETPLRELMPDLGQAKVRQEINRLRRQILDEAGQSQHARAEVERMRQEYHRSLEMQKQRARQFDTWLAAVGRLKVGDTVPIAKAPGMGEVLEVNLPGLRAKVSTSEGEQELSLQDLFPQTGPFARHEHPGRGHAHGKGGGKGRHDTPQPAAPKPIQRRSEDSKAARKSRDALLATPPGEPVFVVPFNKRATLVRINAEKGHAVVQSGVFEMEVPLADLEPVQTG